ncbi:MAG TPA: acyltransferase [Chitinophagaceae bacterium]|nr:acyltransferase [Chitinophagaceae bacterium]
MQKRIHNLDGFRFVAAFIVLLGHATQFRHTYVIWTRGQHILNIASQVAVSFFFILSGFLITHLLLQYQEKNKEAKLSSRLASFYRRRMLRIWPLYYLLFFICFFVIDRGFLASVMPKDFPNPIAHHPTELTLGYLFFMPNYTGNYYDGGLYFLGPTWSLGVEEFFYLFFPIGFYLAGRKNLGKYLVGLTLVSFLLFMFCGKAGPALFDNEKQAWVVTSYLYRYRIYCFALGGLIAWAMLPENRMSRINHFFSKKFFSFGLGILIIYLLATYKTFGFLMHPVYTIIITLFLYTVICSGIRFSPLNFSPVVYLGKISYGIYLLHPLCIATMFYLLKPFDLNLQSNAFAFLFFTGTAVMTIGLSILSYELFEKFFLRLRDK